MKILFVGGSGLISNACSRFASEQGIDLTLVNRSKSKKYDLPAGVKVITCDIHDEMAIATILEKKEFDVVVDWIAFTEADIERDIRLFKGKCKQFVFISSASAYQKPPQHYILTEQTPLENPYNEYARNKITCEIALMKAHREIGFPVTIIRPSSTYGEGQIPVLFNSWFHPYTIVDRMRQGKQVIIPGDGTSLWVFTWNFDFARGMMPLMGEPRTIGQTFHITSDEALTWNQIYDQLAQAAGVTLNGVHIASDFIISLHPEEAGSLLGDRGQNIIFDNSKIRSYVPEFKCEVPWKVGMERLMRWFDSDVARRTIDEAQNEKIDHILAVYQQNKKKEQTRPVCSAYY